MLVGSNKAQIPAPQGAEGSRKNTNGNLGAFALPLPLLPGLKHNAIPED